jgi:hypothetical protein
MSFSGWYPSIGRSSDPNEETSSDDKYNVVSSDYVVIEMNASHWSCLHHSSVMVVGRTRTASTAIRRVHVWVASV